LALDPSGVDFADSTGVGALIRVGNATVAGERELVLRHPSAWVARVLHITGLDAVFELEM
jgi:anti-anti-sigma factor